MIKKLKILWKKIEIPFGIALCFISFISLMCVLETEAKGKEFVCVPLHVNLNDSLYKIIKIDTIYTDTLNYKRITYKEKSYD